MSQWVHATSKVMENIDLNIMQRAFERMKLKADHSVHNISNSYGSDTVDFGLIDLEQSRNLSLGIKMNGTNAEVRGDFWCSRWRNQNDFIDDFSRNYQRCNIEDTALANGYTVESEEVHDDGSIEMYLTSNAF